MSVQTATALHSVRIVINDGKDRQRGSRFPKEGAI